MPRRHKGLIRTTYDIVTPESAEEGDYAESGWEDEEGERLSPGEAVKFLRNKGIGGRYSGSSTSFHPGIWYSAEPEQDYQSGEDTTYSFHLKGYTKAQERGIYNALVSGTDYREGKVYQTAYGERMRHAARKTKSRRSR